MGELLSGSSRPLLFGAALPTPQSGRFATLPLNNLGHPMFLANQSDLANITAVHPAVLGGVNWFNVFWSATCFGGAFMMYVLSRRAVKRFIDKAVNFFQFPADADMAVSVAITRACPNPTLVGAHQTAVKAQKIVMCKHDVSIH